MTIKMSKTNTAICAHRGERESVALILSPQASGKKWSTKPRMINDVTRG